MLSNEPSFEKKSRFFKELFSIINKISLARGTKINVSSRIRDYCSTKDTCFCVLFVELNEGY